jgi:hypothetical protein
VSDKLSLPNLGAPFAPDFGKEQLVKTYAIRLHYHLAVFKQSEK